MSETTGKFTTYVNYGNRETIDDVFIRLMEGDMRNHVVEAVNAWLEAQKDKPLIDDEAGAQLEKDYQRLLGGVKFCRKYIGRKLLND